MQQVDVLIFVEHIPRELDIACAIRHLAKREYALEVVVESFVHGVKALAGAIRPRVIVVPNFRSGNAAFLRNVLPHFPNASYVNLACEQLLSKCTERYKRPSDALARNHVLHLASGDAFRDYLYESGVERDRVQNVGSLSCQLYRAPYRRFFEGKRELFARQFGLDASKPWVFLPENYAAAFFTDGKLLSHARRGGDARELEQYREFARDSLNGVMYWCLKGTQKSEIEMIVRPRPAAPLKFFQQQVERIAGSPPKNFHVIKDYSIREWILASNISVSTYSTSLVDAAAANKPAFILAPVRFPDCMHSGWHASAPHITNFEEFLELLQRADTVTAAAPSFRQWVNDNLMASGDAIANVAHTLNAICKGRIELSPPPAHRLSALSADTCRPPSPVKSGIQTIQGLFRRIRRADIVSNSQKYPFGHDDDQFSSEEVARRTDRWCDILTGCDDVSLPDARELLRSDAA